MDDRIELPYPNWQVPLQDAIIELDRDKLAEKALKVEHLILQRLQELQQSNNGHNERMAINDGLSILRSIRHEWPGASGIGGFIGSMVGDPRVWLLALALYLLRRRRLKHEKSA